MRFKDLFVVPCLLVAISGMGSTLFAQDSPPGTEPTDAESAEASVDETSKKKIPFALYVEAGIGSASAETINSSIESLTVAKSSNFLELRDEIHARAALGWKLPEGKGDFRLLFNGFKEDGYRFSGTGRLAALDPGLELDDKAVADNLLWWIIEAADGTFTATRSKPQWTPASYDDDGILIDPGDDLNLNDVVEEEEVRPLIDFVATRPNAVDLQNRAQSIDLVYGRRFGGRRYSSHWWTGLRYFKYEGNIPAAAWLKFPGGLPGTGYTDGFAVRVLDFSQDTSGFGPTVAMEADFNFFEDRLTLYLGGQAAFVNLSIEADSGEFVTLIEQATGGGPLIPFPARLTTSRNKSTWQDSAEAGARFKLKNGLQLELAYHITGFLDVILLPTDIRVPETAQEGFQGTSAIYNTQDYLLDGWRAGIAYQF